MNQEGEKISNIIYYKIITEFKITIYYNFQ